MIIVRAKGTKATALKLAVKLDPEGEHQAPKIFVGLPSEFKRVARYFKEDEVVLNWGSSNKLPWKNIINRPHAVSRAVLKNLTYIILKNADITVPEFTEVKELAKEWTKSTAVYCRTIANGARGKGIVIATDEDEVVDAPLYTKYWTNTHEFRVHVFLGEVIDYVQKKKKRNADVDLMIKNHNRGWVFAHEDIIVRKKIKEIAVNAVEALDLHFGAVDVLAWFEPPKNGKWQFVDAAVCEVNTAPGLSNSKTLDAYVSALSNYL